MSKRIMSDAEIKRRKRLQGHISQTTGAIGLGALAGTMVASRAGRKTLRKIPKVDRVLKKPPPRDPNRDHIKGALTPALAASAGIGGIGAFNFAAYTNSESRKRQSMQPVKKRDEMAPEYGEVAKAWSPQTKSYNPEAKRQNRNKVAGTVVGAAGAGALGGATYDTYQGVRSRTRSDAKLARSKKLRTASVKTARTARKQHFAAKTGNYNYATTGGDMDKLKALSTKQLKGIQHSDRNAKRAKRGYKLATQQKKGAKAAARSSVVLGESATRSFKSAGKWGAGGAAALGTGMYLKHKAKSRSWEPYAKRDTSAFGVSHD